VSSDLDVIKRIVDAFERSDWAEIDVRAGSLRIRLTAGKPALVESAHDGPLAPAGHAKTPVPETDAQSDAPREAPRHRIEIPSGAHVVVSPSPGIFWRSPQPGAPPFADVGHRVKPDSTLCIVEVMKLMNHVKSGVAGTIAGVFLEDGVTVEQGDALFAVAPAL
jgi:acetyl-CoA carboxylase biotin carboxyl carrier protein